MKFTTKQLTALRRIASQPFGCIGATRVRCDSCPFYQNSHCRYQTRVMKTGWYDRARQGARRILADLKDEKKVSVSLRDRAWSAAKRTHFENGAFANGWLAGYRARRKSR
jgi:hypothetical protein